ncbi:kelch-like protein 20 [Tribolium madens]|uniref:kelch-like protein 20 n=1 Tax=Tribolium madens TaxID=41895 RepID=UPI001CF73E26|nr:kelch-like protein 20 [Tribolium madens]
MEENYDIVTLQIKESTIRCSRADLIKHSDYFKAMFEGNFTESSKSVITLNGVDPEALTIIIKLIWDREYVIEENIILSVVQAACMLQFLEIKNICIERITSMLCVNNCLKIWCYTEALDLPEVSLKAKLLSLLEFKSVKDSRYFLELDLNELINYAGSVHLHTTSEFEIFESIMKWYCNVEEENFEMLLKLLHCLDFNALKIDEVREIVANPKINKHETLPEILNCVISLKKDPNFVNFNTECINHAKCLLKSKSRNLHGYPCILLDGFIQLHTPFAEASKFYYTDQWKRRTPYNDLKDTMNSSSTAVYLNLHSLQFKKFLTMNQSCETLNGFRICGYKQFVFLYGGEQMVGNSAKSLGKGRWNLDFCSYDVIKDCWKTQKLPFPRRHFETCICGKYLFVVGGTGPFRVIQDNLFWYDLEEEKWSEEVKIPCVGKQIKCCSFGDKLFILNINNKCGYLFSPDKMNWTTLTFCDSCNDLPPFSDVLSLFCYKSSIYIKEKKLFELEIQNDTLVVIRSSTLEEVDLSTTNQVESVLCNNTLFLYIIDTYSSRDPNEPFVLELLNVDTLQFTRIAEKFHILEVDKQKYMFRKTSAVFFVFHPNLVKGNDLVNVFLKTEH